MPMWSFKNVDHIVRLSCLKLPTPIGFPIPPKNVGPRYLPALLIPCLCLLPSVSSSHTAFFLFPEPPAKLLPTTGFFFFLFFLSFFPGQDQLLLLFRCQLNHHLPREVSSDHVLYIHCPPRSQIPALSIARGRSLPWALGTILIHLVYLSVDLSTFFSS